ncbi:ATP-binding protein [Oscillochloris sp. ZM17-4]|uniref:ATP-binding protein n=1 Tax=Oscillochloris sp. ZM17-4 TaxID=2866714 RepID=UPI001C72D752|nr:ATP-binding protein [Oscillochloris sp. ZM17-4]
MPYGHPHFGQLQRCQCLEAAQVAARQAVLATRAAALTTQLQAELGRLQHCTLERFDPHRPLPGSVEWDGKAYTPAEQRKSLLWAYSVARQYEPVESLYIHGSYGSGKSHLAAGILHSLAARGVAGRYGSAPALLRLVRQGFRDGSADDRLEALMTVPLLVIDDLGTEHESGWSEASLFDLINIRYLNDRATIFTSNDPVEAHRDERIITRINGTAQIVTLVAFDHRRLGHVAESA